MHRFHPRRRSSRVPCAPRQSSHLSLRRTANAAQRPGPATEALRRAVRPHDGRDRRSVWRANGTTTTRTRPARPLWVRTAMVSVGGIVRCGGVRVSWRLATATADRCFGFACALDRRSCMCFNTATCDMPSDGKCRSLEFRSIVSFGCWLLFRLMETPRRRHPQTCRFATLLRTNPHPHCTPHSPPPHSPGNEGGEIAVLTKLLYGHTPGHGIFLGDMGTFFTKMNKKPWGSSSR